MADGYGAEKCEGGRNHDAAAEDYFRHFVGGSCCQTRQGDVILLRKITGVGEDYAYAATECEKYLTCGGQPDFGVFEGRPLGVPEITQAVDDVVIGSGGVGRTQQENPRHKDNRKYEKHRQGILAGLLNATTYAQIDYQDIQDESNQEEEVCCADAVEVPIFHQALITLKKCSHSLFGGAAVVFTHDGKEAVTEQPGLDINIVYENDERAEDAYYAEVLYEPVLFPKGVKHPRCGGVSETAAEPAYGPFNPHQRQAKEEKGNKVGNHKCPATVSRRLDGKP